MNPTPVLNACQYCKTPVFTALTHVGTLLVLERACGEYVMNGIHCGVALVVPPEEEVYVPHTCRDGVASKG